MNLPSRVSRLDRRAITADRRTAALPARLQSHSDVLALLEAAIQLAEADAGAEPLDQARTLGALASVALKALEARDLEARVAAVERVLKLRKERR